MSSPDNTPSSRFGRGWIPAERAIGLPGEGSGSEEGGAGRDAATPLPQAGGAGGGPATLASERAPSGRAPTPNPSRLREGLKSTPSSSSASSAPSAPLREIHGAAAPTGDDLADPLRAFAHSREPQLTRAPVQHAAPTPEPRHDGFTPERQVRFLDRLATSGTVRAACLAAGISPQAAYLRRRRCARFAAAWDAALVLARDHAEAVLAERALDGVEEAVFYHGEEVARRRRFDGLLLLAHLARLDRRAEHDRAAWSRAARFDELLGLLAGADASSLVAPEPWTRAGREADPFLPPERAEHVALSIEGLGPRAAAKARARAEVAWAHWQAAVRGTVDGLVGAGGERAGAPPPSPTTPAPALAPDPALALDPASPPAPPAGSGAGPTEFKSRLPPPGLSGLHPVNIVNFAAPGRAGAGGGGSVRRRSAPPCRGGAGGIVSVAAAGPRGTRSRGACPAGEMPMIRNPLPARAATALAAFAALAVGALAAGTAQAAPIKLSATLTGPAETPPGKADGVGGFTVTIDPDTNDFCYTLWAEKIGQPTMAHLHTGAAGASGPPVLTLEVTGRNNDECLAVDKSKLDPIVANPAGFYVNVHTADFPAGAVRGQLTK